MDEKETLHAILHFEYEPKRKPSKWVCIELMGCYLLVSPALESTYPISVVLAYQELDALTGMNILYSNEVPEYILKWERDMKTDS